MHESVSRVRELSGREVPMQHVADDEFLIKLVSREALTRACTFYNSRNILPLSLFHFLAFPVERFERHIYLTPSGYELGPS